MKRYNFLIVSLVGAMMFAGTSFGMDEAGLRRVVQVGNYRNRVIGFVKDKLEMISRYPQYKVGPAPILNAAIKNIVDPSDYRFHRDALLDIIVQFFNEGVDEFSSDPSFRARYHANRGMANVPAEMQWYEPFGYDRFNYGD